jgi:hypothetical protein
MQLDDLTRAAQEPFDPGPEIDAAIASHDLAMCYRLAPQVARQSSVERAVVKTKLRQAFPQDFSVRDWDRIVDEAKIPAPVTAAPNPEPDGPDLLSYPHTDAGNAERLIALSGQDLRFCVEAQKWLVWDGVRWAVDDLKAAKQRAKRVARLLYLQAGEIQEPGWKKSTEAHSRKSESAGGIRTTLESAEHEPGIPVRAAGLDADHWLLNAANGTVDLRTGNIRTHRREDLITKLAPVSFDPAASAPRWEQFLLEVFEPHPDLIPFIQRAVGYSLTGSTREECLFLLHGTGRNGKGTLLKLLTMALGDYAGTADFSNIRTTPARATTSPTCGGCV